MKISKKDVEDIAHLARLKVDESLVGKYAEQISDILKYIDKLKDVDISGAELVSDASFNINVLRADDPVKSGGPAVTLVNAPERIDDFFQVPNTIKPN
ncbi:MAG: Asp-tRNA(Asn)/Glu-tRNA(Gln) amidotransferase subunit GatC [Desulfobacteraceae bacterium]|nr:Asp-tRNA(Asn)/Glu-tRNA(Gln) amidotransferase subunit GatC [Desulfobacteraceae bacterium]